MAIETEKMDGGSLNETAANVAAVKALFPEAVREGKIDFEILKSCLGEAAEAGKATYSFTWNGKEEARAFARARSMGTLRPCRAESKDWDTTGNLYIEGDNLEVLKLLQGAYHRCVKMIYIDPPYNTGKDFVYADNFRDSIRNYKEQTGQVDSEGRKLRANAETSGRYHTDWLNMMFPRLLVARNLLRDDGVIFISIDDNEVANLRKLCDEVFGEDNFLCDFVWNSTKSVTNTAIVSVAHNYNLVYCRDSSYFVEHRENFRLAESGEGFSNPDNDPRGPWKADPFQVGGWRPNQQYEIVNPITGQVYLPNSGCSWKNDHEKFKELLQDNRIVFGASGEAGPQRKRFLSEAKERGRVRGASANRAEEFMRPPTDSAFQLNSI